MRRAWLLAALAVPVEQACASGGAHVVDDAEVETPGVCHAESWLSDYGRGGTLANVAPACTFAALPNLEVGGAVQRVSGGGDRARWLAGPALKLAFRPVGRGPGLGVAASAAMDTRTGRIETAGLLLPASFALSDGVRAHANLGYVWSRDGDRHAATLGAQIDARAGKSVWLMAEVFARDRGKAGMQAGVRWTPRPWIDVDLLAGRRVDGVSPRAATLGITLRR